MRPRVLGRNCSALANSPTRPSRSTNISLVGDRSADGVRITMSKRRGTTFSRHRSTVSTRPVVMTDANDGELLRWYGRALWGPGYLDRMARALGLSRSHIARMCAGQRRVTPRMVERLRSMLPDRMTRRRQEHQAYLAEAHRQVQEWAGDLIWAERALTVMWERRQTMKREEARLFSQARRKPTGERPQRWLPQVVE